MITIRPYEPKDRGHVEAICLSPEQPDFDGKKKKTGLVSRMMLTAFCSYYVEQEPGNCLAIRENVHIMQNRKLSAVKKMTCYFVTKNI